MVVETLHYFFWYDISILMEIDRLKVVSIIAKNYIDLKEMVNYVKLLSSFGAVRSKNSTI